MDGPLRTLCTAAFAVTIAVFARAEDKVVTVTTTTSADPGKVVIYHESVSDPLPDPDTLIITKKSPPEPKDESALMAAKPDEKAVWIPGYWRWNTTSNEYEWVSGVWRRSIPNNTWHAGKWVKVGDEWVWQRGYWSGEKESKLIVVKEAPPAIKVETKGDPPGPDYIWIPGVWKYEDGSYKWIPGSWERSSTPDMTYVPGYWQKTGDGYEYIPGHWDYRSETRTYIIRTK